jgi:VanZ family protein
VSKRINTRRLCSSHLILALTVIYVIGLSYLTLAPDPWWIFGSPGRSVEQTFDSTLADYVQHAIVYSMLGVLLAANSRTSNCSMPMPLVFGLCHAVGTECLQYWIPLRSFSAVDGLANVLGLTAGWFIVKGLVSVGCLSLRSSR